MELFSWEKFEKIPGLNSEHKTLNPKLRTPALGIPSGELRTCPSGRRASNSVLQPSLVEPLSKTIVIKVWHMMNIWETGSSESFNQKM